MAPAAALRSHLGEELFWAKDRRNFRAANFAKQSPGGFRPGMLASVEQHAADIPDGGVLLEAARAAAASGDITTDSDRTGPASEKASGLTRRTSVRGAGVLSQIGREMRSSLVLPVTLQPHRSPHAEQLCGRDRRRSSRRHENCHIPPGAGHSTTDHLGLSRDVHAR